jgi:hypothetical protein
MAHRDGYTKRLPVRVYTEKHALFRTFLGVAFGQDFGELERKLMGDENTHDAASLKSHLMRLDAELSRLLAEHQQRRGPDYGHG